MVYGESLHTPIVVMSLSGSNVYPKEQYSRTCDSFPNIVATNRHFGEVANLKFGTATVVGFYHQNHLFRWIYTVKKITLLCGAHVSMHRRKQKLNHKVYTTRTQKSSVDINFGFAGKL